MKSVIEKLQIENSLKWPDFFNIISRELLLVEDNLIKKLETKAALLKEIIRYIFCAGGKRFRPALCLLIAKATGGITDKHIILAELTELIHTASLIHDDIIDSAKLRRGRETVNSLWNDKISVIAGDFLFAEASIRLGELENTEIVKIYAKVLSDLCNGEIEQYSSRFNTQILWETYIQKSTTKTASLFAAACKSAVILNSTNNKTHEQANLFGRYLGIAFQIVDDIIDFIGKSEIAGKEIGTDLRQGIITAPTLFAIDCTDERANQVRLLIENRFNNKEDDFKKAINLIKEMDGCEKAKQLAVSYISKAKECLNFAADPFFSTQLSKTADYILNWAI